MTDLAARDWNRAAQSSYGYPPVTRPRRGCFSPRPGVHPASPQLNMPIRVGQDSFPWAAERIADSRPKPAATSDHPFFRGLVISAAFVQLACSVVCLILPGVRCTFREGQIPSCYLVT